jgi:hypothetical protein
MADGHRMHRALAWIIVGAYVAGSIVGIVSEQRIVTYASDPLLGRIGLLVGFGWFALVGAVVVARRPRNLMGWLLVAIAIPVALGMAGNSAVAYLVLERGHDPTTVTSLLAWPNNWTWYLTLGLVFVYVPLLFPTGRLLSSRWRVVAWLGAVGIGGTCVLGAIAADIGLQVTMSEDGPGASIPNPVGVEGLAHVEQLPIMSVFAGLFIAALLGALASLVVRFRRSSGVERRQMTWLVLAISLVPPTIGLEVVLDALGRAPLPAGQVGFLLVVNAIPLAIGLAVLRYRLYDIDRVVSRTVSYLLLTLLLVGIYAGGVVGLGWLARSLSGGEGTDLVVAASTLAVAALFQPLRTRVQGLVDRRFNRTRYDAEQTVAAFAQRLRDEVDLDALSQQLREAARTAIQPRSTAVWLLPGDSAP